MASNVKWTVLGLILVTAATCQAEEKILWGTDLAKAFKQARDEHKLVLVHFYSDSCVPCRAVEQKVFPQAEVVQAVSRNYIPVKVNADKAPQIAAHYNVRGWPTDVYLTSAGQELHRDVTSQAPDQYVTLLDQLAIQAGIGAARQAALQEREARFEPPQYQGAGSASGNQQQFVPNQYAPNRYVSGEEFSQPPQGQDPRQQALPQNGSYQGGTASPTMYGNPNVPGQQYPTGPLDPRNTDPRNTDPRNTASSMMQRAQWQDQVANGPDITAPQQPIRNQYVRVEQAPPIALEGYCPVSICPGGNQKGQWKKGDRQYGAVHRGRTYLFASPAEQGRFLADPDAYSPVLSGADPVLFAERGELVEGRRNFGIAYQNRMYFFVSEENLTRFQTAPHQYSVTAHQAMMRSEAGTKFR